MNNMINNNTISDSATILDALKLLNDFTVIGYTLFVTDYSNRVIGTITDGDIRRRLIGGGALTDCVTTAMNREFSFYSSNDNERVESFHKIKQRGVKVIPILDEELRLVGIIDTAKQKSMLPIDAVLMAGGKGERLRPLTDNIPKPLLKVGDKTIIDHNIDRLLSYGIQHITVTVNYLKEQIEEHFSKPRNGVKINTVREPKFLGTIGSVKFVNKLHNDTILVMNSDLFTNINYEDFYLDFVKSGADMSVAAIPYSVSIPYGILEVEKDSIKALSEKPTYNYYANAGIYLIKKQMLSLIPDNEYFDATDLIELLIAHGSKVIRFPITGYWIDIGKNEDYNKANELVRHINSD